MTQPAASRPSLPWTARLLVAAVVLVGGAVVLRSALVVWRSTLPAEWVLFAALTVASGALSIKIPSIQSRFSVSEVFAFASVLLFGPEAGALILACDGLRISLLWRMNATQTAFNVANLGLSIWLAGRLFFVLSGAPLLHASAVPSALILVHLAAMTAAYFAMNAGLTAGAIALSSGRSLAATWREHFWPLVPSYLAGASIALLLVLAYREVHFAALTLMVPLLLICYLTLRSSFGRLEDAKQHVDQVNRLLLSTVETLASAIDAKDEVTHDHVRRVQRAALATAKLMGVHDAVSLQALEAAALLHDTGKIAVPEHILNKPGPLTPAEFEQMKQHAPIGAEILSSIDFPYPVVPIVRHHHENWDGTGYPDRLAGERIPLGARILSVVDCFDALTSDRPYRRRMTNAQAIAIIMQRRGVMYDPAVVDIFVAHHESVMPAYDPTPHPVSRVIEDARLLDRAPQAEAAVAASVDAAATDGLLAVSSLSRALNGEANAADAGALLWALLKEVLPCDAMAILAPEAGADRIATRFATGQGAAALRGIRRATASGVVGWVAATRRPAVNADPGLDLRDADRDAASGLRSCLAIPILEAGSLVAVLALYRAEAQAFSEDHVRLLELLAARLSMPLSAVLATEPAQAGPLTLVRGLSRA